MPCQSYTVDGNREFLASLNERVCSERIPLCGSIDLTDACNLDCVHCYVRKSCAGSELSTEQVKSYIDQMAEAGCLFLLLTGGEPLLRDDFTDIYKHAKYVGLVLSIFTNGTLIDEQMADMMAELPPHIVEISIYGATNDAHDKVTGVEGSFERSMNGFRLLKERGVDVLLKTILMKLNKDELQGMLEIADINGSRFRVDGAIFPKLDGDKSPLDLRLSPEEVVEREFLLPGRAGHWCEFEKKVGKLKSSESLYDCGAGVSCFHITANGVMKPCIMAQEPAYDLKKVEFNDAWAALAEISDRKPGPDYPCNDCERRLICDNCPGFFGLENGAEELYSTYVCDIAREREKRIALVNS
ncbi:hypothetical protein BVX97_04345 [bacterium E08(2017)]|nr:hypothetical protein BVX97_04345 [bacterium E08(2017)]